MNGVNSARDVCIGNSRAAAFSFRFVWVTMTSGCAVEKMLHKEDVLGGGKLKTCKLSTLVSLLCVRYTCAGISAFSSVLDLEGQRVPFYLTLWW